MSAAPGEDCGGFTLGSMHLALPMSALREVLPLPGLHSLLTLPCPAACVAGGIDLRGTVIPVVDLNRVLGRASPLQAQPCVIIVVHGGRLLGLLADGVTGVFSPMPGPTASAARRSPPELPASGAIFAGSLRRADTGALVSLLSPAALSRLPQVPMTDDPEPGRENAPERAHEQAHEADDTREQQAACDSQPLPVMLIRCGSVALAIDALAVHATLSDPQLRASAVAMGHCKGVMDYDGRSVPAVDLLALCGLGAVDPESPRLQAFLMRFPQGLVGLLVDEVIDVINISRQDVVPVPAFALPEPALFAGALPATVLPDEARTRRGLPEAQYLLLCGRALLQCPALTALSEVNASDRARASVAGVTPTSTANAAPGRREMITYECFGEEATPIEQIAEILRFDAQMAAFTPRGALVGLVVNRGRSIPVMCLRRMTGLESVPLSDTTSVLVVKSDEDWVGFAVPRLRAIEAARWSPALPGGGLGRNDALAQTLQSREMALFDAGGSERMLRVLDLHGIARRLREGALAA